MLLYQLVGDINTGTNFGAPMLGRHKLAQYLHFIFFDVITRHIKLPRANVG